MGVGSETDPEPGPITGSRTSTSPEKIPMVNRIRLMATRSVIRPITTIWIMRKLWDMAPNLGEHPQKCPHPLPLRSEGAAGVGGGALTAGLA